MHKFAASSEMTEAISRVVAGTVVAVAIWRILLSGDGATLDHALLQYGVLLYCVGAIAIMAAVFLQPKITHRRNILCVVLDVVGVSGGLYFGAGIVDPIAIFYLWIMLGSGLVYGVVYLFIATGLSLISFGAVYMLSPYWQANGMFSLTIAGLLIVLGPYMAFLLASLHRTRRIAHWQADHDSLTEVLNRRAFERELSELVPTRCDDVRHYLLYCDLDLFKRINDTAGHAAGDQVLRDICHIFRQHTPPESVMARMGGDEFCVLLRDLDLESARRTAETLRSKIASYSLTWGSSHYSLSVSIGVAPSSASTEASGLIRLADAACYAAKNGGRDQIHVVDAQLGVDDTQTIRHIKIGARNDVPPEQRATA